MTNDEKILQMLTDMTDKIASMDEHITSIDERITSMDERMTSMDERMTSMDERMTSMDERMTDMSEQMAAMNVRLTHVESEVVKINITIENDVMKRLNLLADGYAMTHDKQIEMENRFDRKTDALDKRVEKLEIRAG